MINCLIQILKSQLNDYCLVCSQSDLKGGKATTVTAERAGGIGELWSNSSGRLAVSCGHLWIITLSGGREAKCRGAEYRGAPAAVISYLQPLVM